MDKGLVMFNIPHHPFKTSYIMHAWIEKTFGEDLVDVAEIRDHRGYLKSYDVTVKI